MDVSKETELGGNPTTNTKHNGLKVSTQKGWKDGGPTYRFEDGTTYKKPKDLKVYGLVFYGRWDRVQILECYLRVRGHHGLLYSLPPPADQNCG